MMQTFAFEIAAAFFLAAILMGGSFLRGFFSQEILRGFKLAAIGLIVAGAGLWVHHSVSFDVAPTPAAVSSVPDPVKQVQKSRRAEALRESDRKALAAAMAEEAAKPDAPAHITVQGPDEAGTETTAGKRGSKIVRSVGRALHIVPKAQP